MIRGQGCDLYSEPHDQGIGVILQLKHWGPNKRHTPHLSWAFLNSFSALRSCKMWITWWTDYLCLACRASGWGRNHRAKMGTHAATTRKHQRGAKWMNVKVCPEGFQFQWPNNIRLHPWQTDSNLYWPTALPTLHHPPVKLNMLQPPIALQDAHGPKSENKCTCSGL